MKKLVNTPISNKIWWATVNEKNGSMNTSTRIDVTNNAIQSVLDHLMMMDGFEESGFSGYNYNRKNGNGGITLCAIDTSKVKLVKIKEEEE